MRGHVRGPYDLLAVALEVRDYGGPVTSSVRAFDQRVQATFV